MSISVKLTTILLATGWLAQALATTNSEIDAGVAAYTAGDHEAALGHYAQAEDDLGERPELHYNKGLALLATGNLDDARKAFERGTESDNTQVHASAEYELGNLDLDAEAFEAAIDHYINCLKLVPSHANAKWNLELALLKKQQKEEEQKKQDEQDKDKDKDKQDDQDKDDQDKDDQDKDDQDKDDQDKDDQDKDEQDEQDKDKQDEDKQDEQDKDKQDEQDKQDQDKPEKQDDQGKPEQDDKDQGKPEDNKPPPQDNANNQEPQPQPLDKADLDKALEQLDAEDEFLLGRVPQGRPGQVEKDW